MLVKGAIGDVVVVREVRFLSFLCRRLLVHHVVPRTVSIRS
jgi:hypothetical protein